MNINGMTNIEDVIDMIKDTIDNGDLEGAKDYLEQFKESGLVRKSQEEELKMPFPDARDQHLINRNFNKATGGK